MALGGNAVPVIAALARVSVTRLIVRLRGLGSSGAFMARGYARFEAPTRGEGVRSTRRLWRDLLQCQHRKEETDTNAFLMLVYHISTSDALAAAAARDPVVIERARITS